MTPLPLAAHWQAAMCQLGLTKDYNHVQEVKVDKRGLGELLMPPYLPHPDLTIADLLLWRHPHQLSGCLSS